MLVFYNGFAEIIEPDTNKVKVGNIAGLGKLCKEQQLEIKYKGFAEASSLELCDHPDCIDMQGAKKCRFVEYIDPTKNFSIRENLRSRVVKYSASDIVEPASAQEPKTGFNKLKWQAKDAFSAREVALFILGMDPDDRGMLTDPKSENLGWLLELKFDQNKRDLYDTIVDELLIEMAGLLGLKKIEEVERQGSLNDHQAFTRNFIKAWCDKRNIDCPEILVPLNISKTKQKDEGIKENIRTDENKKNLTEDNKKQNLENQTKESNIPYNFSELPSDQQRALLIEIFINWGVKQNKLTRHNDGTVFVPTLKHTLFSEIRKQEYSFLFNGVDRKVIEALFKVSDSRNSTLKLLQDKGIDFEKNAYNQDKNLFNQYHVPNNTQSSN